MFRKKINRSKSDIDEYSKFIHSEAIRTVEENREFFIYTRNLDWHCPITTELEKNKYIDYIEFTIGADPFELSRVKRWQKDIAQGCIDSVLNRKLLTTKAS